ncbi:MAG: transcription antitermination factor NusB [Spirochaetes bacterium GWB1_48_6]|nr:MAG: transcription antitermination factor NusB [Spirochaetes bacterium GWB1_48_6]
MGSRRQARIVAFQALFSHEMNPRPRSEVVSLDWMDQSEREQLTPDVEFFARNIINGTLEHLPEVDKSIKDHLKNWDFDRIGRVDLAILRISTFGLLFLSDVPPKVTIDEAIDIAKKFGSTESYRFINGVLDGINKETRI